MRRLLIIYLNTENRERTKGSQNVIQKNDSVRNDLDYLRIVEKIILKWRLKCKVWGYGIGWVGLEQVPVAGSPNNGEDSSGSMKGGEFRNNSVTLKFSRSAVEVSVVT